MEPLPDRKIILIFIKSPEKGMVKTRLAAAVGEEAACELYRNFVLDMLDTVKSFPAKGTCALQLFIYPPEEVRAVDQWLGNLYDCRPQQGRDLGERMQKAFQKCFEEGFSRVLLVGSDTPDLPERIIEDGFAALEDRNAVIGPAHDGGYYLIGFRYDGFLPEVFANVAWSTGNVYAETMDIFRRSNRDVSVLPTWRDVDTLEDLKSLMARHPGGGFTKSRTMRLLLSGGPTRP